jgi:c-di-GMP-binding flagellar brake protein YcgR
MLFSKQEKLSGSDPANSINNTDLVTSRQQIIQILTKVIRDHRQLEARIKGVPGSYNTTILGINPKTGILAIDAFRVTTAHETLLRTKKIHLFSRKDGVELECDLNLISFRHNTSKSYYQMSVPDTLIYVQRRNDHRVQLAGRSLFRGHFELEKNKPITGYAADISLHGLGVVLKIPNEITQGDKIFSCMLQLEDESPLYFDLTVCFVQKIPQRGSTRIGCQFDKLDRKDKNRIAKIIRTLERKQAQMVRN